MDKVHISVSYLFLSYFKDFACKYRKKLLLLQAETNTTMAEEIKQATTTYNEDNIVHLDDREHIRRRPGMYIGKLGDGSHSDDGIYVLIKETIDNCIDEFRMNEGKVVEVNVSAPSAEDNSQRVRVRDYGRGIPLGKMVEAVSILNTGGKYDTKAFKKSVGLNGVGTKAVNALSLEFAVQVWRDNKTRRIVFKQGHLVEDSEIQDYSGPEKRGTLIEFVPDNTKGLFENYRFRDDFIETMMRNYAYLNVGLTLNYNGKKYSSKNGLFDLLTETMTVDPLYPIIHVQG
jgi:topoisomerase-4 subunit B